MMRFRCPGCSVTMQAPTSESGEKRKCPKCQAVFRIPLVPGAKEPSKRRVKKEKSLVPVVCGVCGTRVYAELHQVGAQVKCPDCFTLNTVPKPQKQKRRVAPELTNLDGYDLAPAQEIEVVQSLGQQRLEDADDVVQEEIEAIPKLPSRPFLNGVFTYPLRLQVWPTLVGISMAWTFFVLVMYWTWNLKGLMSAVAPVILGALGFFAALVVIPSLVTFQKIMENGAIGDDDAEIRPDGGLFSMVEWVGEVIPLAIAATVCCGPTIGVYQLLAVVEAVPSNSMIELAAGYLAYLLFPVILLSMLENSSLAGFYSGPIWGGLRTRCTVWFKFYLIASILFALMVGAITMFVRLMSGPLTPVTMAGFVGLMAAMVAILAVYFRVIGRLGFVLTIEVDAQQNKRRKSSAALV